MTNDDLHLNQVWELPEKGSRGGLVEGGRCKAGVQDWRWFPQVDNHHIQHCHWHWHLLWQPSYILRAIFYDLDQVWGWKSVDLRLGEQNPRQLWTTSNKVISLWWMRLSSKSWLQTIINGSYSMWPPESLTLSNVEGHLLLEGGSWV